MKNNHLLDDDDAALIAVALKENTNLRALSLEGNDLTDIGFEYLDDAIFDSKTLNSASDSNHTCFLSTDEGSYGNENEDANMTRARKIYTVLSNRSKDCTNAQHFDEELGEDSLLLVPWVLACLNSGYHRVYGFRGDDDVHPLSIMYEGMRSWKMPELYERHGTAKGMTDRAQLAKN